MHRHPFRLTALVGALSIVAGAMATGAAGAATPQPTAQAATTHSTNPVEVVPGGRAGTYVVPPGIHKIQHVIVIMQENRSFDSYFGTYPGADGIQMRDGRPVVCVPGPHGCTRPFHTAQDDTYGGPHGFSNNATDVDGGKMDGFIMEEAKAMANCPKTTSHCRHIPGKPNLVMGYHDQRELPNYWAYAQNFALQDHMFSPVHSWSLPDHLYMVSAWSARCKDKNPYSCVSNAANPYSLNQFDEAIKQEVNTGTTSIDLAWTDITWLLYHYGVSWAYYVETGTQPDCQNDSALTCSPPAQSFRAAGIWNPLPLFEDVHQDHQLANIQPLDNYFAAAHAGTLPHVSWIVPSNGNSDHPPNSVHQGQAYTTAIINAAMQGPDWGSTAIFLSWDEWGGLYDNVVPPTVDDNGYGIRVPSLVISPYAKAGYIDHQTLSSDAYLKFIEDDFMTGARLNPATDGRPDPRPDVRENQSILGNLVKDFDFHQAPRPAELLPTNPPTDSPTLPSYFIGQPPCVGCTTTPPYYHMAQVPNPNPTGG